MVYLDAGSADERRHAELVAGHLAAALERDPGLVVLALVSFLDHLLADVEERLGHGLVEERGADDGLVDDVRLPVWILT